MTAKTLAGIGWGALLTLVGVAIVGLEVGSHWDGLVAVAGGMILLGLLLWRPLDGLALFSALWAPSVFILKDSTLGEVAGLELNLSRALGGILVVGLGARLFLRLFHRSGVRKLPGPLRWYTFFAAWLVWELIRSPLVGQGIGDLVRFGASYLALLVVVWEARTHEDVRQLHVGLAVGAILSSLITVGTWVAGSAEFVITSLGAERAVGSYGSANASGNLAVLGIAVLVPFVGKRRDSFWEKLLFLGSAAILMTAIAVTFSRTAILGTLLLISTWLLVDKSHTVPRVFQVVMVVVTVLALGIAIYGTGTDRVARRLSDLPLIGQGSLQDDDAGSGRVGIWKFHWYKYTHAGVGTILLGAGLGSSMKTAREMAQLEHSLTPAVYGPHNSYLWLLVETGVIGLGLYMVFLVSLARYLWRAMMQALASGRRAQALLFSTFLSYLVAYQLSKELFGWGITKIGVRWYFIAYMAIVLVAAAGWNRATQKES